MRFLELLYLTSVLAASVSASVIPSSVEEVLKSQIKDSKKLSSDEGSASHPTCTISDEEECALSKFSNTGSTLVKPGGDTRCIFSNSGDYAFQVWPGASDKLMVYFQGGGACWDKVSTKAGLCSTSASPGGENGVFCRGDCKGDNSFEDYTIVHILYCSGDAHIGAVVRDYNDNKGVPVSQQGAANVQAALDWIKGQSDYFTRFTSLLLMGCSAGSLGVQAWAHEVMMQLDDAYGFDDAAVVPDSYAGVFPPDSQSQTIQDFGACNVSALDNAPELKDSCKAGTITLQEMTSYSLEHNPETPYAFLNSKSDEVQISYYIAIAATVRNDTDFIQPEEYYRQVNEIFEGYSKYDNVIEFLVQSDQHCYTNNNHYWTADTSNERGGNDGDPTMLDWVNSLPLNTGDGTISTECKGDFIDDLDNRPKYRTTYCYEALNNTFSG